MLTILGKKKTNQIKTIKLTQLILDPHLTPAPHTNHQSLLSHMSEPEARVSLILYTIAHSETRSIQCALCPLPIACPIIYLAAYIETILTYSFVTWNEI